MGWMEIMWWTLAVWLVPSITAYCTIRWTIKIDNNGKWTVVNRAVVILLSLGGPVSLVIGLICLMVIGGSKWAESDNGRKPARW